MGAERTLVSTSPEATEALAAELGRTLPGGTLLALDGDLGAGKTCFVRGLASGLGIEAGVASPTYTLMQAHEGGRLPLFHFDAWMEGREKAFLMDGGDTFLSGDGIAVVEWAERVLETLPSPRLAVEFFHVDPETRRVRLHVVDEAPDGPLAALLARLPLPDGMCEEEPHSG